jgi:hypothetical protein
LALATGAKARQFMNSKIKYTNDSLGEVKVIADFLPSPAELAFDEEGIKVTLALSKKGRLNSISGLYVVTLNNSQPISANADDKRIAHKAIKVNKANCKFGKAINLENRKYNYYKTFGQENVNFIPIASLSEIAIAEQEILKLLSPYRLISPSGNLTEWMHSIDASKIIDLAIEILDNLKIPYETSYTNLSEITSTVNFSQLSTQINEEATQPKQQSFQENKKSGLKQALPDNYQLDEYAKSLPRTDG